MNRLNGATQPHLLAKFLQGEVTLFDQKSPHLSAMGGADHRFAPGQAMAMGDVTGVAALLEELFNHAQRDAKAVGNLVASTLVIVVGLEDSLPQIQRKSSHTQGLP